MADKKNTVIGTFDGECADASITNLNGLDITREVWENVFNGDEFKQAIEQGWYIGYLGHPEDPNCMDFEHACIVMTDGYIDDDNKIYGSFNLIDTPVGRVVKSFIDAGVQFGISVRGSGDIENNSVDPDTFVFRGFDLVTFPAYPESIPKFQEIAASTDLKQRAKYRKVCAAIKANIDGLPSTSIDVIQPQFAEQSREYEMLERQKAELEADDASKACEYTEERLDAIMRLFLDEKKKVDELESKLADCETRCSTLSQDALLANRKYNTLKRVAASQQLELTKDLDTEIRANERLANKLKSVSRKLNSTSSDLVQAKTHLSKVKKKNQNLTTHLDNVSVTADQAISEVESIKQTNLIYKNKINSLDEELRSKEDIIASLRTKLSKTVGESEDAIDQATNLEAENERLMQQISATNKILEEYQDAYAKIYAHAIGAQPEYINVNASTSVSELQKSIQISNGTPSNTDCDVVTEDIDDETDDGLTFL